MRKATLRRRWIFGIAALSAGGFIVACAGDDGADGARGPAGETGPAGPAGETGEAGSCSVSEDGGVKTVSCTDGTSVTLEDGASGSSCSVADNMDGTKTISCEDGTSVTVSDGSASGPAEEVAMEACAVCHGEGREFDVALAHGLETPVFLEGQLSELNAEITAVDFSGATPVVSFSVTDQDGEGYGGLPSSRLRFTFAQLLPGVPADIAMPGTGVTNQWSSYITRVETPDPSVGDGDGSPETQASYERASSGTLTDLGGGNYSYTFAADIAGDAAHVATNTHRVAMQLSGGGLPAANAVHDFRPDGGAITETRDIIATDTCNNCHNKLAIHGGGRTDTQYCVTCHNPGSIDANSDNSVDMTVMVHKIHMGRNLPSVQAGGHYTIWGYRDSPHDYSEVGFPVSGPGCESCHKQGLDAAPDAARYTMWPSAAACGSCHDDVDFVTGANHAPGARGDHECTTCHTPGSIEDAHSDPAAMASANFAFEIDNLDFDATSRELTIDFSVSDPIANSDYDILADPEFTQTDGTSRLAVLVGWSTRDYDNTGSGSNPGKPISINPLSGDNAATKNADGSFRVTATVPDEASGSGVVAIEGHPAGEDPDNPGSYTLRVPVRSALDYFGITDATPVPRRQVVDVTATCNNCHGTLSMHGANRTDEGQVCVICHAPNATDLARRPDNHLDPETLTADGLKEQTIDFKHMIHAIHGAGKRENAYVAYGFGNREHVYSSDHVTFPGILNRCDACHVDDSYKLPLDDDVLATTIDSDPSALIKADTTPEAVADPSDDWNISPTAAVCSACHDSDDALHHMTLNGAGFEVLQSNVE